MVFQEQATKSRLNSKNSETQYPLYEAGWLKGNYILEEKITFELEIHRWASLDFGKILFLFWILHCFFLMER